MAPKVAATGRTSYPGTNPLSPHLCHMCREVTDTKVLASAHQEDCQVEEVDPQAEDMEEVEEMDMTQGMEMKRRMRMMLRPLLLKIREKFCPEDWTDGSGE